MSRLLGAEASRQERWQGRGKALGTTAASRELNICFKPFKCQSVREISPDGESLTYPLGLDRLPSSIVLTDVNGSTSVITPQRTPSLAAENIPEVLGGHVLMYSLST